MNWIDWKGGECPVPRDAIVETELRSGPHSRCVCRAGEQRWYWTKVQPCRDMDIIAYRVIDQEVSLAEPPIEHGEGGE